MKALDLLGGTEIVSVADSWEMLRSQSVGRVAFSHAGKVEVFPVNYALQDGAIVFATNPGRKLTGLGEGEVAFEVDFIDPVGRTGWSVVVHGDAAGVIDPEERRTIESLPWAGPKRFMVRIAPRSISGRRLSTV